MIIAVESPVAKGYWEKNLASQLIQEAYAYADMEIQPKFEVAGKEGPERLVTPKPRIKTNQEILEDRRDEFAQDLQLIVSTLLIPLFKVKEISWQPELL